jgi:hypothetical protein
MLDKRHLSWCEREQLTAISALSVIRMDDSRETWTNGQAYAAKNVERLRAFFQFCVDQRAARHLRRTSRHIIVYSTCATILGGSAFDVRALSGRRRPRPDARSTARSWRHAWRNP